MLLRVGLRNLLRRPRRTLGIVLAVALGTGSLFLIHGFNAGIMNQYRYNAIHAVFGSGEVQVTGYADKVHERPWEHWIPDYDRLAKDLSAVPGVTALFPRISFQALLSADSHMASGIGWGGDGVAESAFFTTVNLEQGHDLGDQVDGIVLGRELARSLGVGVGDRVTVLVQDVHGSINGADFRVSGIFHTGNEKYDFSTFKVQLARVRELLDTTRVERVYVGLADGVSFDRVAARFPGGKGPYEAVPFEVLDAANYGNTVRFLAAQFQIVRLVVLVVVILGLTGVLAASIFERRTEVGILRANGESRADVLLLLGVESTAMGAIGGALGLAYGLFVVRVLIPKGILMPPAPGLTRQFMVQIELQPEMAAQVVVLGMVIVLAASWFAARRVLKGSVAELLRST
jgi:putative ABC transport system permease protein